MILIPYGKQHITEEDIAAVVECLKSDYLTQGPRVQEFEKAFAEYVGAKHAVAVNSATAALHLAMLVGGVGPGHRVVTSPITFLASANCAAFVGAIPDFSDVDPVSLNLCPDTLRKNWLPDIKAVVVVDYAGQAADIPAISKIAKKNGALVIEDACHGVGGAFEYGGKTWKLGGHPWADMTTFSFHPVKTMTTGEGGMLVTDNDEYASKARILRSHGVERSNFLGLGSHYPGLNEKGPWYYEMHELGYNYRLTDLQCALGMSQLKRLDQMIVRRREIVEQYNQGFKNVDWLEIPRLRNEKNKSLVSWHLYSSKINFVKLGTSRSVVVSKLREKGIGTQVLYIPVHLQPWYRKSYGYSVKKCPVAEDAYHELLSFPLYPMMTDEEVDEVIRTVKDLENKGFKDARNL